MSRKSVLLLLSFLTVAITAVVVIKANQVEVKRDSPAEIERIIAEAEELYRKRAAEKMDMTSGPCLTNDLRPGWVVDIVHSPRQSVDNLPQNQCPAYLEGRATHFVELDTQGKLVRIR